MHAPHAPGTERHGGDRHRGRRPAGPVRLRGRLLSGSQPPTRWQRLARANEGEEYAASYAARFRDAAARGEDIHGEAALVERLVAPPARVLDAGCGTGRITVRLAALGYRVVGVDVDPAMLAVARAEAPGLDWRTADLATDDLATDDLATDDLATDDLAAGDPDGGSGGAFDLVLLAGNIVPLLEPGTLTATCRRLAAATVPGGLVVCGFGLDADHLPPGCPPTPLAAFEQAADVAGLTLRERFSSWQGAPYDPLRGYVVSVHSR